MVEVTGSEVAFNGMVSIQKSVDSEVIRQHTERERESGDFISLTFLLKESRL
jgi:hypothetical protein